MHASRRSCLLLIAALCVAACGPDNNNSGVIQPPPNHEQPDLPVVLCPDPADTDEPDSDGDGLIDRCDNCPELGNPDQLDQNHDGFGDACDDDDDGDGYNDDADNCPGVFQHDQRDTDEDGRGDVCDACPLNSDDRDSDGDDLNDCIDLCAGVADANNADGDGDGVGDVCDNCPGVPNHNQLDDDGDGDGNACDESPGEFSWVEASAASIHAAIKADRVTCEEVVQGYIKRIQRYDLDTSDGPPINAFITLNDQVLGQARALDAAFKSTGQLSGPMHCMPIVLKDLYNTQEMPVSSGTLELVGTQPKEDAFVVARMREQGAIIFGITTMDEFSKGIDGISSRSGRTGNSYAPDRSPGGSSAGTGAALGANFAVGGTGTDNCASLTVPAAYNGLVTVRPTLGLISLNGVFPSNYLDAAPGPMARTVRDMALMLDAMAGKDEGDARTSKTERPATYMDYLKQDGLRGKRIGVLRSYGENTQEAPTFSFKGADAYSVRVFGEAIRDMRAQGATVVENVRLPDLDTQRTGAGFIDEVDYYLEQLVDGPHSDFLSVCEGGEYSKFAYESMESCANYARWAALNANVGSGLYTRARDRYLANARYISQVLDALKLDALLLPVDGIGAVASSYYSRTHCVITSVSGTPSMVIQVGYSDDAVPLPIGMMLIGRKFSEPVLLELAYGYEQATLKRQPPALTSNINEASIPAIDFEAFYDLRLAIGRESYERHLRDGGKFDLTPARFTEIVRDVVEERGEETWLLGEQ